MSQKARSTFVLHEANEILQALVGLKDVRVLHYERSGPDVELMIEQAVDEVRCPSCGRRAQVKERPVVRYVDLPVYGTPMRLAWRMADLLGLDPDRLQLWLFARCVQESPEWPALADVASRIAPFA